MYPSNPIKSDNQPAVYILTDRDGKLLKIGETQNLISQTIERFSFLNEPITAFFETVKVNDEDSEMRCNRLNLLSLVCKKIELIADFKKIER